MSREYVKSGASLVDVSSDKIRNFACLEDVRAAILAGELAEGDMFTTICQTTGCTEDIAQEVCRIASDLDSYATKSCVCTIVNGIFSLSGNVLTITSA